MTKFAISKPARLIVGTLCIAGLAATVILLAGDGKDASEEWKYTTKVMSRVWAPIFSLILLLTSGVLKYRGLLRGKRLVWTLFGLGLVSACIPIFAPKAVLLSWGWQLCLSLCWICAFFCGSLVLFILAGKSGTLLSWVNCSIASLLLGLSFLEGWLLCTAQPADWQVNDSGHSQYASQKNAVIEPESWQAGICGIAPLEKTDDYAIAHRGLHRESELFDVKYEMTAAGRRKLPIASQAQNDLLLFGCSFTFGHGLDNEVAWAHKLATDLGSNWQVVNYAVSGYGAEQMLCLLEHGLIDPPKGERRLAFFLGIEHQMLRNEFFMGHPHYQLNESGAPLLAGVGRFVRIKNLPNALNGSQLARELSSFLTAAIAKDNEEFRNVYVAMLASSAKLLKDRYGAELVVLLWPDLEYLAKDLERLSIPYILLKTMLPKWDEDEGRGYRIHPLYEAHPNALASDQLAAGLAEYLKREFQ